MRVETPVNFPVPRPPSSPRLAGMGASNAALAPSLVRVIPDATALIPMAAVMPIAGPEDLRGRFPSVCIFKAGTATVVLISSLTAQAPAASAQVAQQALQYRLQCFPCLLPTMPDEQRVSDLKDILSSDGIRYLPSVNVLIQNDGKSYEQFVEDYLNFFGKIGTVFPGTSGVQLLKHMKAIANSGQSVMVGQVPSILQSMFNQLYPIKEQSKEVIYATAQQRGVQFLDFATSLQGGNVRNAFAYFKRTWMKAWRHNLRHPTFNRDKVDILRTLDSLYNPRNQFLNVGILNLAGDVGTVGKAIPGLVFSGVNSGPSTVNAIGSFIHASGMQAAPVAGQIASASAQGAAVLPFVGMGLSLLSALVAQLTVNSVESGQAQFSATVRNELRKFSSHENRELESALNRFAVLNHRPGQVGRATTENLNNGFNKGRLLDAIEILQWFLGKQTRILEHKRADRNDALAQLFIGAVGAALAGVTGGISLGVAGVIGLGISCKGWYERNKQANLNAKTLCEFKVKLNRDMEDEKKRLKSCESVNAIQFDINNEAEYDMCAAYMEDGFIALGEKYKSILHKGDNNTTVGDYMRAKMSYLIVEAAVLSRFVSNRTPEQEIYFNLMTALGQFYGYNLAEGLRLLTERGGFCMTAFFQDVELLCGRMPRR